MAKRRRRRSRKRRKRKSLAQAFSGYRRAILAASVVLVGLGLLWTLWPFWQLSARLDQARASRPSRLYGRPLSVAIGSVVRTRDLTGELDRLGYREVESAPARAGEFRNAPGALTVFVRERPTPAGWRSPGVLETRFRSGRVSAITWQGQAVESASLEAPILASFVGSDRREKRPIALAEVPDQFVEAVLAAEDASFYKHAGLSLRGIGRATWANLRGLELQQGGSTLTQQLVKNIFLTHERTLARKLREVVLAILVDLRYEKEEILSGYLNEIYWGSSSTVNLIGVGAASWAYFGKHPSELDLCESALLAGMIHSPGSYSLRKSPERAIERRNWVLTRMKSLGWLSPEEAERTASRGLCYSPHAVPVRSAPYFLDLAAAEAERRFGLDRLDSAGYVLLSTLDHRSQRAAEEAVAWGLEALEKGWEKSRGRQGELQAALVSIEPETGEILAYLGGRDYRASQFDRASLARRQAGSAFKPIVYAAAFEKGTVSPASFVEDAPLTVLLANRRWSPQNSDGDFRGWVTVRTALERSLNIPTVRVALDVGLPAIVETAHGLGVQTPLEEVPALALGAFEVTPLDLATVYATLAAGGVRSSAHALRGVLDSAGQPIGGTPLPKPVRALSAEATFVLTSVLRGVVEQGTGAGVRRQGLLDPVAGKTGTTNDRRDSWFGGYSPGRATLVWVGYDDNSATQLSGARAALPIWTRFTYKVRPVGGYSVPVQPRGVLTAVIDPASGQLATGACPDVITEFFLEDDLPERICRLHGDWQDWSSTVVVGDPNWRLQRPKRRPWRWLSKVFGKKRGGKKP
ncbi:MAG: PBP1A family penicillin-binding protein [bacterium]|nr:PBP1A family penicillin-binding protein [bacterium]